jgi:hypothetical protein
MMIELSKLGGTDFGGGTSLTISTLRNQMTAQKLSRSMIGEGL